MYVKTHTITIMQIGTICIYIDLYKNRRIILAKIKQFSVHK